MPPGMDRRVFDEIDRTFGLVLDTPRIRESCVIFPVPCRVVATIRAHPERVKIPCVSTFRTIYFTKRQWYDPFDLSFCWYSLSKPAVHLAHEQT